LEVLVEEEDLEGQSSESMEGLEYLEEQVKVG
jgi:hypothetical protein